MDIREFTTKFEEVIEDVTPGSVKPDTIFRELEQWDSMAALNIITMLSTDYNVEVKGDQLAQCKTVSDVFNLIAKK